MSKGDRQRPWNQRDLDERWGYQNRITEAEQFERWFYHDSCSDTPIQVERSPTTGVV